ncbi:hypothetical protein GQF01_27210 [Paenibacillus sp. 5J-6]|uniref:RDD domain-containing protein n=1 Tax=Paenibacillus silvestris TaxID=2606219 RepID=A0A6L8V8W6_9BACL|nr:RDD family protein [Paenibacillus silvestris]MZQ85799.1 hypothetical protein [Paenibacillus silvestris]
METENILCNIAGFWQRVGMRLLDLIIAGIPCVLLYTYSLKLSVRLGNVIPFVVYWIFFCAAMIFFIVKYGGTPGKLIMKAKIIDKNGERLTILRSVRRIIFYIIGAGCLIPILDLAIQSKIEEKDVVHFLSNSSSMYQSMYSYFGILTIVSDLLVLFNPKRRALHDFIAGSFVVVRGK